MRIPVVIPKATISMAQATIVRWLKGSGDPVELDEILLELETDKAVVDVPSPAAGILSITVPGGEVAVEQTIGWIAPPGDVTESAQASVEAVALPLVPGAGEAIASPSHSHSARPAVKVASPAARRRASELSVDLDGLTGTGPGGRITEEDVVQAAANKNSSVGSSRRSLSEHVLNAWQTVPHIHIARNIDVADLVHAKQNVSQESPGGITLTDLILFSVARILVEFPEIVGADKNETRAKINLAFAVATPDDNVVTPVIPHANVLSLPELSRLRRQLTDLALSRSLRPKNLEGGAFTVTNLGMEGVDFFVPIINAPQRAILAVGRITQQPVVNSGRIEIGWRMWANLAADHRYVDGAMAARCLSRWQQHLHALPEESAK